MYLPILILYELCAGMVNDFIEAVFELVLEVANHSWFRSACYVRFFTAGPVTYFEKAISD